MNPLFRSRDGKFAVYPCKCGCDMAARVTPDMEEENVSRGFYISSHAPLGAAYEVKGQAYDFTAAEAPGSPPVRSAPLTCADDWDEKTPVCRAANAFDDGYVSDEEWDRFIRELSDEDA